ncbi:WD40-repeat-containing domain protein [Cladochytrium replicatum]|nr:WD40-repeat-containing domain protein [Cladochytrium replicatum]
MENDPSFVVLAGTYERILYGLNAFVSHSENGSLICTLEPVFIFPAHLSCIKSIAASPPKSSASQSRRTYLATGSTDETIKVYDLRTKREIGSLGHHKGAVTQLAYFRTEHLITAGEEGDIAIVRTHDWTVLKTLTGHKSAVTGLAVHPTGKLALSVGKDRLLKCWNLSTGTCAYASKLKTASVPDRVRWGTGNANIYAVGADRTIEVFRVDSGDDSATLEGVGRINSFEFVSLKGPGEGAVVELIVTGGEDRMITLWDIKGKPLARWNSGHASRIKDLSIMPLSAEEPSNPPAVALITCSSDGAIRVWDLLSCIERSRLPESSESMPNPATTISANTNILLDPIGEYNCDARVTCLTSTKVTYRKKDAAPFRPNAKRSIEDVEADDTDGFETDVGGDEEDATAGSKPVVKVSIGDTDPEDVESTLKRAPKNKKFVQRRDNGNNGRERGGFKHKGGEKNKEFGRGGKRDGKRQKNN